MAEDSCTTEVTLRTGFAEVSVTEAAQGLTNTSKRDTNNLTLTSRTVASDIQRKELWLTDEQKAGLHISRGLRPPH
jgi:hypothetical protein